MNKLLLLFGLLFASFASLQSQVYSSNRATTENATDTATINALIARITALEIADNTLLSSFNREDEILAFASGKQSNTTTIQPINCTITKTNTGRYTVSFLKNHPNGNEYGVLFGVDEDGNRDVPKASVVMGSQTALGFSVIITVDDNGSSADIYRDDAWSFSINYQKKILTHAN